MSYEETYGPGLVIQHTGQFFPLGQEPVTLGRANDNTLVLADPEVSAYHAAISWQANMDAFAIEDLGSASGTYVNEVRVTGQQQLRHGDVIRTGNTIIDLKLEPTLDAGMAAGGTAYPLPDEGQSEGGSRNILLPVIIVALLAGITVVCLCAASSLLLGRGKGVPSVVIQSPPDGARILVGNEIILQATASGASDITFLELSVDGRLVATATNPSPGGASSLTANKIWTFERTGEHLVSAVAYTANGKTSKTESIKVTAIASGGGATPTPTETSAPGEPTNTPAPTSTPEPEAPQIEYLRANPQSINAGECTTLEWGKVSNATGAKIEPDVGGVATPGSAQVCPGETTSYVLVAEGPGGTTTASVTVSVSAALADLLIDSIEFDPNPAVKDENTEVRITIRNAGPGAADGFNWEWQAGSEGLFDGRLRGLGGGEATVVTVRWKPANAYASLPTEARVDTDNEVPETNEDNNRLTAAVEVVEGSVGPGTVTLTSDAALDGYRGNDGSGSSRHDVLAGNGHMANPTGELVWRGFMSFDLSGIPDGATIESVELRFYQAKVGGDPYDKLGNLILDHVDYGSSLDASAYNTPAMDSAGLPQLTSSGVWYIIPGRTIASWVERDLSAGRPATQLRLRFSQETDGDGDEDYVGIESGDNFFGTGNAPELIVFYQQ